MKDSYVFPRIQAIPQIGRASLCIDGRERVGYEFGEGMSRPFLFPLVGPAGAHLTRMGHPNPVGHEHHKSVWFGHQNVAGINFWEEKAGTDIRIRHRRVVVYQDGAEWGGLVAEWDWWAQGRSLLRQELTIAIEPARDGGFALDLQSRFELTGQVPVELGRTNFGFLGVRLAKTMLRALRRRDGDRRSGVSRRGEPFRQAWPLGRLCGTGRARQDRGNLRDGSSLEPRSSGAVACPRRRLARPVV